MAKGIVYILTNPSLDGWIKIGMTERNDIGKRLSELNSSTSIPLSFRVFALYHVENPSLVEKSIHSIFDAIDPSMHALEEVNGIIRTREFFQISPEKAYGVFKNIAILRGDIASLELIEATEKEQAEEMTVKKRKNFSFKMLGIPVGEELIFFKDDSEKCIVHDDKNNVEYGPNGEITTLSSLGAKLLNWNSSASVQGPKYFLYNGETLYDWRHRMENEGEIID